MRKIPLHIKIIIALVLGISYAFISSYLGWNKFTLDWIDPFGEIFVRLLKLIAVPIVLFSIIGGIGSLSEATKLGRLGLKTILLYMSTTFISVSIGLILVNTFKPGHAIEEETRIKNRIRYELWAVEEEIPIKDEKNFLEDPTMHKTVQLVKGDTTIVAKQKRQAEKHLKNAKKNDDQGPLSFLVNMVPQNATQAIADNSLMLQVIFFAIFFGICLISLPRKKAKPVVDFIQSVNLVFLKMVGHIMNAAPYFVFCLLAGVLAEMADTPAQVLDIFKGLGSYALTLLSGLLFMIFIFYPIITSIFIRGLTIRQFFKNMSKAQFLAFSTSSSAATLPVTMDCVENNMGVSKNISSFVLPIGATVNMDGTSMLQGIAVLFLAQMHMIDLTVSQQLMVVLTAAVASIGTAAVPSAGLVMMIIVLQSVGLNPVWIAILFPIDRPLDMVRTVVNITGDATVSSLIAKSEGEMDLDVAIGDIKLKN